MNDMTLTDRYIDTAMRTVPEKQRDDLAAELRGSIADQVDAREDAGEPRDAAERTVLTELGDPEKLAAGYTGRTLHLIGPTYYLDWWRLLKLLLWIVLPCVAFGVALGQLLSGASVGGVFAAAIGAMLTAVLHIAFWTTLVFVVLERTGHETMDAGPWTPDRLPLPRDRGAGLGDVITALVWLALVAGALVWDHFIGLAYVGENWQSALDPALWPWWIAGLFAVLAVEAVVAVTVYARRRWTPALAVVNGILNLAIIVPALWLLTQGRLVNPDVIAAVSAAGGDQAVRVVTIIVGVGLVALAVWDTVDAALKAVRAAR